ncbi:DUF4363 family protein [Sinanaerobacter sp. ZZT-01]|uniref:DUF4363 family protein n=1 Tax=Sinanaerobacter sp. ZZT-01 TaxID=3111540 RepID=UPI002D77B5CF|nr:DUF4363 family protein [Sinanaerobacter sp. ZZT-01]WRR92192.1 DUF4363 family protein [Sinanaerobacter sp. ZZT-01]
MFYCEDSIDDLSKDLENQIITEIENENWATAEEAFKDFSDQWHENKKIYTFFLDTKTLLDTDFSIGRAEAYIKLQDSPLALGELSCIQEQLKFLYLNEKISLENIM